MASIGHMGQNVGQKILWGKELEPLLATELFNRVYPHIQTAVYAPSRKNQGIFITLWFCAAGSNQFPYTKGKKYTAKDVALQRKIFDGSRTMTPEVKETFHPFDMEGLSGFLSENLIDSEIRDVLLSCGIPPTERDNKKCLSRALAMQFKSFVDSDTDEADDIVSLEYQKLLAEPSATEESNEPPSVFYPGDNVYLKSRHRPTYSVNVYEKFQHTWEFDNTGTLTWRGRRLYFSNHKDVRPRTQNGEVYLDLPDVPPGKGVKITVGMTAHGFEGRTECDWIMIDSEGNNCFPRSGIFTFVVNAKFQYDR